VADTNRDYRRLGLPVVSPASHRTARRLFALSTLDTDVAVPTRLKVTDTNIRERLITNGFEEERLPVFTKATVIQLFVMMGMAPIFTEGFA